MISGNTDFYSTRHGEDGRYGNMEYPIESLTKSKAFTAWLQKRSTDPLTILDVGCGQGIFISQLKSEIERNHHHLSKAVGIDLIAPSERLLKDLDIADRFEFQSCDIEGGTLPFEDNQFDFVSCNHVLEHIFNTENLVRELFRVTKSSGLVLISVPNIGAWINRFLFLFGYQMIGSELGSESMNYGIRPKRLQKRWDSVKPAGHIRDFTMLGLSDLLESAGFKIQFWWNHDDLKCLRFPAGMGRKIGALCSLNP